MEPGDTVQGALTVERDRRRLDDGGTNDASVQCTLHDLALHTLTDAVGARDDGHYRPAKDAAFG